MSNPHNFIARPKRSLGQNFLRDDGVIRRIVAAVDPREGETVLEIGPGRGALTERLLQTGASVLAVEIDRELVPILRTQFHFEANFRIVEADILETDVGALLEPDEAGKVKLVGNLPYYISTAILQKLALERHLFQRIVLMLQREVVDRITAPAGSGERGFLTVMVESAFETTSLFDVPPTAFIPQPKVWSSVIALTPKPATAGDDPSFRRLVSAAFAQKRKTLFNNLKTTIEDAAAVLEASGIDPRRRAETLSLAEWYTLAANIK